jgi:TRAP-type C4-dicarboxylate transport system permease small subunit
MKFIILFVNFVDRLNVLVANAVSTLLPVLVCMLVIETVARYIFNHPTIWAYDISIFLFGYLTLLGGAYVQKLNEHVNVDIIYHRLSTRSKAVLDVISGLLVLFFLILIIVYSWNPAIKAIKNYETTMSEWAPPIGHFKLMIPIACFLIFLQTIANWFRSLYRAVTNKEL